MRNNAVQFAVVREDPELEVAVMTAAETQRPLLIASGGCTAFTLQARFPEMQITLVEPNPAQLALVDTKRRALAQPPGPHRWELFNVGHDDPAGLNACGNFESLFRGLRQFLSEFVVTREEMLRLFDPAHGLGDVDTQVFANPYWPVAFELFFADALLVTMFGSDAVQYAPRGSYPRYFQHLLQDGLRAPGAVDNPFLHHVFLGHYLDRPNAVPAYLHEEARDYTFEQIGSLMQDVPALGDYDFIGLSNIMDWMAPDDSDALVARLASELAPGARVMWRQLNNSRDIEAMFGASVSFDEALGAQLQSADRSLFYSSVHVGTKRG